MSAPNRYADPIHDPLLEGAPVYDGFIVIGQTILLEKLAESDAGNDYLGKHLPNRNDVRIAIIRPLRNMDPHASRAFSEQFIRDSQPAAAIKHANLIPIRDIGIDHGWAYVISDMIKGESLTSLIRRVGSLPEYDTAYILSAAAEGIAAAHQAGVIHRSINPDHIIIAPDSSVSVIGLAMGGAVQNDDPARTMLRREDRSRKFIAPEYFSGATSPGPASDVWSLGMTMYYLLTGGTTNPESDIASQLNRQRADISIQTQHVMTTALCQAPADRYPDAAVFARALHDIPAIATPASRAGSPALTISPIPYTTGIRPPSRTKLDSIIHTLHIEPEARRAVAIRSESPESPTVETVRRRSSRTTSPPAPNAGNRPPSRNPTPLKSVTYAHNAVSASKDHADHERRGVRDDSPAHSTVFSKREMNIIIYLLLPVGVFFFILTLGSITLLFIHIAKGKKPPPVKAVYRYRATDSDANVISDRVDSETDTAADSAENAAPAVPDEAPDARAPDIINRARLARRRAVFRQYMALGASELAEGHAAAAARAFQSAMDAAVNDADRLSARANYKLAISERDATSINSTSRTTDDSPTSRSDGSATASSDNDATKSFLKTLAALDARHRKLLNTSTRLKTAVRALTNSLSTIQIHPSQSDPNPSAPLPDKTLNARVDMVVADWAALQRTAKSTGALIKTNAASARALIADYQAALDTLQRNWEISVDDATKSAVKTRINTLNANVSDLTEKLDAFQKQFNAKRDASYYAMMKAIEFHDAATLKFFAQVVMRISNDSNRIDDARHALRNLEQSNTLDRKNLAWVRDHSSDRYWERLRKRITSADTEQIRRAVEMVSKDNLRKKTLYEKYWNGQYSVPVQLGVVIHNDFPGGNVLLDKKRAGIPGPLNSGRALLIVYDPSEPHTISWQFAGAKRSSVSSASDNDFPDLRAFPDILNPTPDYTPVKNLSIAVKPATGIHQLNGVFYIGAGNAVVCVDPDSGAIVTVKLMPQNDRFTVAGDPTYDTDKALFYFHLTDVEAQSALAVFKPTPGQTPPGVTLAEKIYPASLGKITIRIGLGGSKFIPHGRLGLIATESHAAFAYLEHTGDPLMIGKSVPIHFTPVQPPVFVHYYNSKTKRLMDGVAIPTKAGHITILDLLTMTPTETIGEGIIKTPLATPLIAATVPGRAEPQYLFGVSRTNALHLVDFSEAAAGKRFNPSNEIIFDGDILPFVTRTREHFYFCTTAYIYEIDVPEAGIKTIRRRVQLGGTIPAGPPAISQNIVYISSTDGYGLGFDLNTGTLIWKVRLPKKAMPVGGPVIRKNRIWFLTKDGEILAYDL